MEPEQDEVYLDWLAAAPKGVRWERAQEMYEEYQRKCREQAEAVAQRLLGNKAPDTFRGKCSVCGQLNNLDRSTRTVCINCYSSVRNPLNGY